ncbi:hypothetical protein [Streptomyces xanthochromogenes]|uniref:hypothetical protein n=1 Tax=Streptomyces xanthochromogenes TaxID=67384 RepID=UPI001679DF35|nr:hypothetical protein [Streptomyces xanthochromogenes]
MDVNRAVQQPNSPMAHRAGTAAPATAGGFRGLDPDRVPRGPYAPSPPDSLGAALAGLQARLDAMTREVLPEPGCPVCREASSARGRAHGTGDADGVRRAGGVIRAHRLGHGSRSAQVMALDLAELQFTDFGERRPGDIDPTTCPACAMVVRILYEAAATRSTELLSSGVELGTLHALVGHPLDRSSARRTFLARTLGDK